MIVNQRGDLYMDPEDHIHIEGDDDAMICDIKNSVYGEWNVTHYKQCLWFLDRWGAEQLFSVLSEDEPLAKVLESHKIDTLYLRHETTSLGRASNKTERGNPITSLWPFYWAKERSFGSGQKKKSKHLLSACGERTSTRHLTKKIPIEALPPPLG